MRRQFVFLIGWLIGVTTSIAMADDAIPMSLESVIFQLEKTTQAYAARYAELDTPPLTLDHCPASAETTRKGLARNSAKMEYYASAYMGGIQRLGGNPSQTALVTQMKNDIVRMGEDVIGAAIRLDDSRWGWNNLSSDWDAWGNQTCTPNTTPNVYDSARSLMILYWAFITTTDVGKKHLFFDAFIRGVNYWVEDRSNALLATGSPYKIKNGKMDVNAIRAFYDLKPNNRILNGVIVGGQRTDFCPGPGCTDLEKSLNESLFSESAFTLPRPLRFHYTTDDPALVSVNCSGLLGLVMLKMGVTLAQDKNPEFPMPKFNIKVSTRDGSKSATLRKSLLYLGHWTMYSIYHNLAQNPANGSYYDVDTPLYINTAYESHLGSITAPILAEAGALIQRQEYMDAAVRSIGENREAVLNDALSGSATNTVFAFCSLRNLDPEFADRCESFIHDATHYANGSPTRVMNANWLGIALQSGIVPVTGTPSTFESLLVADGDDTPPTVAITTPAEGTIISADKTLPVTAMATDNGGINRVEFFIDGKRAATDTVAPFGHTLTKLPAGTHTLIVHAFDVSGNMSTSAEHVFLVDGTPPSSPEGLTADVWNQTLSLSWSESSDTGGAGVAGYRVDLSTDVAFATFLPGWNNIDMGPNVTTSTVLPLLNATIHARVKAQDKVGNLSLPARVVSVKTGALMDDFEGESIGSRPTRWSVTASPKTSAIIAEGDIDGSTGRIAALLDDANDGFCQMQFLSLIPQTSFYYRAHHRFRETNAMHYALLGNGNAGTVYFVIAHGDGSWRYYDGTRYIRFPGDTTGYVADTWYRVEVIGNLTTGRFSVWINGILIGENISIPGTNTSLSGIRLMPASTASNGGMWVDNIHLSAAVPFYDDFESQTPGAAPGRWDLTSSPGASVEVVPEATASGGSRVVSLVDDTVGGFCQMQYLLGGNSSTFTYRANYRFRETKSMHYAFMGNGNAGSLYFLIAYGDGSWRYYDGTRYVRFAGDTKGYTLNTWYRVEIAGDLTARTFRVWIDGELVGDNVPIPGTSSSLKGIRLLPASSLGSGAMWVDNIFFEGENATGIVSAVAPASLFDDPLPPVESVDAARAYPIPFRPGQGASGITFDQLPEGTPIRIFTIDGRPVTTLTTISGGSVQWNLANDQGTPVASGVYIAIVEKDGHRKKLKIVVQK